MTHADLMRISDRELEIIKELLYEAHLNNDKPAYIEQVDDQVRQTGHRMLTVLDGLVEQLVVDGNQEAVVLEYLEPIRTIFAAALDGLDGVQQYQSTQFPESLWGDPPTGFPTR